MEPTRPDRDIAAIILDIILLKEDWKWSLRHEDDSVVREQLQAAVNLGHELNHAVDGKVLDLIRRAKTSAPPHLMTEAALKAFADFGAERSSSEGWTTKPGVPMTLPPAHLADYFNDDPLTFGQNSQWLNDWRAAVKKLQQSMERMRSACEADRDAP